jgi:hypothetical protein
VEKRASTDAITANPLSFIRFGDLSLPFARKELWDLSRYYNVQLFGVAPGKMLLRELPLRASR